MRTLRIPPRLGAVPWWVLGVLLAIQAVICGLTFFGSEVGDAPFAGALSIALYVLPSLMVTVRAWRTPGPVRGAWAFLAAGMLAYAAGNSYWYFGVRGLDPEPL